MTGDRVPSRIHILDPSTVSRIAAGEVIERPASVVKELTENAIDAGAGTIRIDLTSSKEAITGIRVRDDGCGMSPADARMAFIPHATSKIRSIDDIHRIRTLGFRGEALSTIAAVSKITLTTNVRGSRSGTRVVIEGGEVKNESSVGAPEGTSILVQDLFFNTPARKKFQKSRNTELARIHDIIEALAISHPEIAFHLFHNGAEQLVTNQTTSLTDTLACIFGSSLLLGLIPVAVSLPFLSLDGYIALPVHARKDRSRIFIAVNHRPVTAPAISDAIKAGYGTLLPRTLFPVAFLSLRIDTSLVDVNVHPTKKQVRFSREHEIADAVARAVREALLAHDLIPAAGTPDRIPALIPEPVPPEPLPYLPPDSPIASGVSEPTHAGTTGTDQRLRQTELPVSPDPARTAESLLPPIEVIGEFAGIYIVARTVQDELLLIDQHAAHERILYEQLSTLAAGNRPSQELISPVVLHRTARDAAVLRDFFPALEAEGFAIEGFGGNAFVVRGIPVVLGRLEDTAVIDEIIGDLVSGEAAQAVSSREQITRIVACRGAVKAGTVCTREQCQRIVDQLRRTQNPFTCPHGRPTIIRFSRKDLDAMFRRT